MDKKTLYHIVEWAVALAACAFLGYKLVTFEDYPALWESLRSMVWQQYLALGLCVALMPVNMAIEAWRWRTLWNGDATLNGANGEANELTDERLTFREAQRQVYYSKLAGLITPWRLGEYPARGVLMNEKPTSDKVLRTTIGSPIEQSSSPLKGRESNIWAKVLSMGAVGSATMTAAIVTAGAIGLAFSPAFLAYLGGSYLYALCAVAAALVLLLAFAPRALKKYAEVNSGLVMTSIGQSFVRLACWCVQLGLVMYALGGVGTFSALPAQTAIYYLLVTITPNVPLAEVGVRGAWAIVVFGSMNAALAGVLLWMINTLLPCLVWPFLSKNAK